MTSKFWDLILVIGGPGGLPTICVCSVLCYSNILLFYYYILLFCHEFLLNGQFMLLFFLLLLMWVIKWIPSYLIHLHIFWSEVMLVLVYIWFVLRSVHCITTSWINNFKQNKICIHRNKVVELTPKEVGCKWIAIDEWMSNVRWPDSAI